MVSERAPPGRATAVRRRRRPAGARPRGGTALGPAAVSARPAVRLRLWSRPQAGGGQPQGPSAGGVAQESRDLRYVTANRAPCSLVGHHPYQNHLRPVCQNRSTPHQTPFRRCRHPTWAGLAPRRRRVARRVADRLATRGRGAAQAGRPRLALDGSEFMTMISCLISCYEINSKNHEIVYMKRIFGRALSRFRCGFGRSRVAFHYDCTMNSNCAQPGSGWLDAEQERRPAAEPAAEQCAACAPPCC